MLKILFGLLITLTGINAAAFDLLSSFPEDIRPDEKYVLYLHGLIVEGTDPMPKHPEFGIYDFPAIKQELFESGGFNLIAEHRPKNTNPQEYVTKLVHWVEELIQAGVEPGSITLVGFSRGAQMTATASHELKPLGINTVLIGLCSNRDYRVGEDPIILGGHILSMYETSDVVGSCNKILQRSFDAKSTTEIAITTGRAHGAFYTPVSAWMDPLKSWLENNAGR